MTDIFSRKKRSQIMSLIRFKWTKQEVNVHNYLKGHKVKHVMHPKDAPGADVLMPELNLAILLHGCFWHACKICYREPKTNKAFWKKKIETNIKRDRKTKKNLKKLGFKVVVIWEHQLRKNFENAMEKVTG